MDNDTRKLIERIIENNYFEPMDDALIVYRQKFTMTAGGIHVPESTDNKSGKYGYAVIATILAKGPGRFIEATGHYKPIDVKPFDHVLMTVQAGLELGEVVRKELGADVSFEQIRLIRAHDIITKIKVSK